MTGDVHLAPEDPRRAADFERFLADASERADRLVILGDLFDYWIGPRHARSCAYAPVVAALEALRARDFPVDFIAGNRDFLGPRELASIGLEVWGDALVLQQGERRVVVTHGDLLVAGDRSYKRYRRAVRSWWFRLGYALVPDWVRLWVAHRLRGASRRKLSKVTPLAFPLDLSAAQRWLSALDAQEVLLGHLHRHEEHGVEGGAARMLPGWVEGGGAYFEVGAPSRLRTWRSGSSPDPLPWEQEAG